MYCDMSGQRNNNNININYYHYAFLCAGTRAITSIIETTQEQSKINNNKKNI